MCEIVDKFLKLMEPFVANIESDYDKLKAKKNDLGNVDNILSIIDGDSYKILNIEDDKIIDFIEKNNSNKLEYDANKYILKTEIDEVKSLPQYENAKKYLDNFYEYLLIQYNNIDNEYQELRKDYENKDLVNKYYKMFAEEEVFVSNVEELKKVFDILTLSLDDKNNILIYVLKENNKSYYMADNDNLFSDSEKENVLKLLEENNILKNNEYNELLDAVSDYVDIAKNIFDIIDYDLVDKINIGNILLAKKVWLYRKIYFTYYNMNCKKCNEIVNEFNIVDDLYDEVKNIKNQNEVVKIIKGEK